MEDLRKYTRKSELYKLSAEEQTEKMKLVMKEVEKISAYTGVSEEAAYNLFLNGYDVPSELDGQKIAFSESELTPDLLSNLAENNVRSVKVMSDESIAAGYMDYLHKQKKDNKVLISKKARKPVCFRAFSILMSFDYGRFLNSLTKDRRRIYIHCTSKNKIIRLIGILFRIRSAKNIIPARLKKVINKLNLSQKYSL